MEESHYSINAERTMGYQYGIVLDLYRTPYNAFELTYS